MPGRDRRYAAQDHRCGMKIIRWQFEEVHTLGESAPGNRQCRGERGVAGDNVDDAWRVGAYAMLSARGRSRHLTPAVENIRATQLALDLVLELCAIELRMQKGEGALQHRVGQRTGPCRQLQR